MKIKILNEEGKIIRSKSLLWKLVANGELYYPSVIPGLKIKDKNSFYNCSSPFRKDKKPSFSITRFRDTNIWYHTDFGDSSIKGNFFDFAALRHGLDPKVDSWHLLDKIYEELKVDEMDKDELQRLMDGSNGTTDKITYNLKLPTGNFTRKVYDEVEEVSEKSQKINEIILHEIEKSDLDKIHLEFLSKTGIDYEIMKKHNAFFIKGYAINYGEYGLDNLERKSRPKNEIWICYSLEQKYKKIYCPLSKKFWSIGEKSYNFKYVFGTPAIFPNLENVIVILAAGEKDTLVLLSRGYYAMCLNSETSLLTITDVQNFSERGFKLVVIYDLDNTGITQSQKIKSETGTPYVTLPQWLKEKGGKDITDYFIEGGSKEELDTLINEALGDKQHNEEPIIKVYPIRTASQRIQDAKSKPDILPHADVLFQSNELTIFFGDTGKGKSIFAVALANAISKGISFLNLENKCGPLVVLYYDFELSDKQFEKRYTNENGVSYVFSNNFFTDNIDLSDVDLTKSKIPFEEILVGKIKSDIKSISANIVIIDNITFLSMYSAEDGHVAMRLMKLLKQLKTEESISIMVLAHTPKNFGLGGISLRDLAGSKQLSNFCDSVSALGVSNKDSNLRYIIQVKPSRTGEIKYDAQNVIVCEIQKVDSFLTLVFKEYASEEEHLKKRKEDEEDALIDSAKELQKSGKTIRQIADDLKVSKSTVGRWLKPE